MTLAPERDSAPSAHVPVAAGAPASARRRVRGRTRRSRGARIVLFARNGLVVLLGGIGAASIAWLAAASFFGLHLVILSTGSMSPGMPPGTAAVVRVVDAADLRVGDVVSVPRAHDDELVTHRVVEIEPGAAPGERLLTLRGDANATPDAHRYAVTQAGLVVASLPWVGFPIAQLASPVRVTILAVLIPLAVLWVMWPRGSRS
ncbi:signal peptidase I [Microbacterium album]|uniref:Signal peptidase I n=1 Tax=Microbacterium album TaxID=2053191 RepID=A0A917ML83_9MICO|nr:signal peptidase I [Microbacterium album]GGH36648.1 hypothetical protein GCM10010921_05950 [Microbacterium album]